MGGLGRAGARRVGAAVPVRSHVYAHVVRVGIVATVVLTSVVALSALVVGMRDLDATSQQNAALGPLDRIYGNLGGAPNAIRDPRAIERALEIMPPTAQYALVFGPRWVPVRTPRWTTSLERDFLKYHLLPRREAARVSDAGWIFCFACPAGAFPDARPRVRSSDGIVLLERR